MQNLEMNKIAAAVLLAGIIAMFSGLVAEFLYEGGGGHHGAEAKRGYTIEGAVEEAAAGGAPAAEEKPVDILPFLAKADAEAGKAKVGGELICEVY